MYKTRLHGRLLVVTVPGVAVPIRIRGEDLNPRGQVVIDGPAGLTVSVEADPGRMPGRALPRCDALEHDDP